MFMRYLKLFEAFDSIKLSKTLAFINKEDREVFLSQLKKVCEYLDYPISKLSDKDFEYLPFKSAYSLKSDKKDSGEIIKFWFSKEGEYINKTINREKEEINSIGLLSNDISDYNTIKDLDHYKIKDFPTGTLLYMRCSEGEGPGYLYNDQSRGDMYVIQNFASGDEPRYFNFKEIARYSWAIDGGDYYSIKLIEYKSKIDIIDIDFHNLSFSVVSSVVSNDSIGVGNVPDLKKANFSIVLNTNNLPEISLKKIKSERTIRKEGAFKTNDEIKSENIERYFNKILKSESILSDPSVIFKRLLIDKNFLFLLKKIDFKVRINNLNRFYYDIIRTDDNDYINKQINDVKKEVLNYLKKVDNIKKRILDNKNDLKESLKKREFLGYNSPKYPPEVYLEMIEKLESLSEIIYNKFSSLEMNNLYDVESFVNKFNNLLDYLKNNRNYFSRIYEYGISHFNDRDIMIEVIFNNSYNGEVLQFNERGYTRLVELIKRL
jgi:hypothetical protein